MNKFKKKIINNRGVREEKGCQFFETLNKGEQFTVRQLLFLCENWTKVGGATPYLPIF